MLIAAKMERHTPYVTIDAIRVITRYIDIGLRLSYATGRPLLAYYALIRRR